MVLRIEVVDASLFAVAMYVQQPPRFVVVLIIGNNESSLGDINY